MRNSKLTIFLSVERYCTVPLMIFRQTLPTSTNGPFLYVYRNLKGILEHTITLVLFYTKEHVLFVCDKACKQLT